MRLSMLVFIFLLSAHAKANFFNDTESFLDACESSDIYCRGYLSGFHDTWEAWRAYLAYQRDEEPSACIPTGVSASQLVSVFKKYMEEHPEALHIPAHANAIRAFIDAFDCAKG